MIVYKNILTWKFLALIKIILIPFLINCLIYKDHQTTNESLDAFALNHFIPYILEPTRITSYSKTLVNNILSNIISQEMVSGNITATISDYLTQFVFGPNVLPHHTKNQIFMKETGQNLFKQTMYFPNLIKISLMFSK